MATEFDSQLMCDSKSLNTKIKSYESKINTGGPGKKIPKQGSQYVCLSIIVLDSVSQINQNCYPQVFCEECKYQEKEIKKTRYIIQDIEIFSSNNDDDDDEFEEKENSE